MSTQIRSLSLTVVIFLLAGNACFAIPLAKPLPLDRVDLPENTAAVIGCERLDAAMWYQFYVQRDGALFLSTWIRGDDAGLPLAANPQLDLGILTTGSYRFWVRAWEPVYGFSSWSDPDDFEVTCSAIAAPSPFYPAAGNLQSSGAWPTEYVFSNPAAVTNPTATWGGFQIKRSSATFEDPAETVSRWVEYDFPGQNGVPFTSIPNLSAFLADGSYDWRCREYSACNGIGEWSNSTWGDVAETNCEEILPLSNLSFYLGSDGVSNEPGEHLFHSGAVQAGVGNTPSLNINFTGIPWVRIYIRERSTGEVVFFEWIQFTEDYNLRMPKLKPGTYEIWTQSYHHQCGTSAWSAGPVGTFPVAQATLRDVRFSRQTTRDARGIAYTGMESQPGIDWYQYYVTCGNRIVLNQWFDLEDRRPTGKSLQQATKFFGEPGLFNDWNIILDEPCANEVTVWARAYSLTGKYSEWISSRDDFPYNANAPANLSLDADGIAWDDPLVSPDPLDQAVGDYEVYVQRNGRLYYEDVAGVEFVSEFPFVVPWVDEWSRPTSYEPFFDFAPGDYKVWIRSVAGPDGASPWSVPLEFAIDP